MALDGLAARFNSAHFGLHFKSRCFCDVFRVSGRVVWGRVASRKRILTPRRDTERTMCRWGCSFTRSIGGTQVIVAVARIGACGWLLLGCW